MKAFLLILAMLFCGCDSINEAQKRNTVELPSNPDATEQAKPVQTPIYQHDEPAREYEETRAGGNR